MAYIATIGGKEYRVEVSRVKGDLYQVKIGDNKVFYVDARRRGCCVYSLLKENESYEVDVDGRPNGGYSVLVKGEHFQIDILDEMKKRLRGVLGGVVGAALGEVSTAMPGKVVKVLVEEGEEVREGEPLVILEAMKMENEFKSPVDGVIKSVRVKEGDVVDTNAVLVMVEPSGE